MEIYLERVPLKGELLTVVGQTNLMLTYRVTEVETVVQGLVPIVLYVVSKDDQ
jgi:hypothetical protein